MAPSDPKPNDGAKWACSFLACFAPANSNTPSSDPASRGRRGDGSQPPEQSCIKRSPQPPSLQGAMRSHHNQSQSTSPSGAPQAAGTTPSLGPGTSKSVPPDPDGIVTQQQLVSVVRTPSPQQTATWRPPAPDPAVNDAGEGSLPQITPLDLTVVAMEGGDIKTRSRGQSPLGKSDAFTHAKEASELSSSHESHSEDGADEGIPQVEAASPALAGNVRDNALYGDAANQDTAAGCNPDDCRHGDLHGRGMNSLYGNDLYEAHDCISGWDTANIAALAGSAPNNKVQKQQQLLQLPQPTQEKQSAQLLRLHRPLQQRRLQQQQQHNQQQEQLQQLRLHLQQERQRKRVQLQLQQQQLRLEIQQQLQQMKQQKQQRRQRQRLYRQQLLQQKGQGQEHEQKDLAADKVLFLERQQPQQREEQQTPNPNSKQQRQQQQQTCEFLKRQRPQCTSNVPNDTRKLRQHFMWSTMSSRAKFPKSASFKSKERGPVEVHHLYMGSSYVKSYRCLKLRGSV